MLKIHTLSDLERLYVVYFLANLAMGISYPYVPVYLREIGGTLFMVAIVISVFNLVSSLAQTWWGDLSDRMGKRVIFIVVGNVGPALFYLTYGLITLPLLFLMVRGLQGLVENADVPASNSLSTEYSTSPAGISFAVFNIICGVGYFSGNLMAKVVVGLTDSVSILFTLAAVIFLAAGAMAGFTLHEPPRWRRRVVPWRMYSFEGVGAPRPIWGTIWSVWNVVLKRIKVGEDIIVMAWATFFAMIGSGIITTYLPLFFSTISKDSVGLLYAVEAISYVVFLPIMGHISDRVGKKPVIVFSLVLYILYAWMLYTYNDILTLSAAQFISGVKWASFFNSVNAYTTEIAPEGKLATYLGLTYMAIFLGWTVAPIVAATLLLFVGAQFQHLFLLSIAPIVASLMIFLTIRNVRPRKGKPSPFIDHYTVKR